MKVSRLSSQRSEPGSVIETATALSGGLHRTRTRLSDPPPAHAIFQRPYNKSNNTRMPLAWNEIRDRSIAFSREWKDAESERAESQTFWNEFFNVFGIIRKRVAVFEKQVQLVRAGRKLKDGRIDAFWKGVLLIEHKSTGADLDRAFTQAADYFDGLPERDLPRYILVSDFQRFRLCDLEAGTDHEFALKDLHKHIKKFGFVAGYSAQTIKPQDPVNIRAAEQMGRLHDLLKAAGYAGHDLEVLLVRLVFCLFADDTGIFEKQSFRDWLESRTAEDGADLGPELALLFQVLDTPPEKRQKNLEEQVAAFPYVNGSLFGEALHVASFDAKMRATLLDCCALNWSGVSPAIFGALFQSIMDGKSRRNLGAHYTSEENILKLIRPLFLDDLWAEFQRVKGNKNRLFEFHKKLRTLTFLDPACGCGNFLVITYRELRLLELEGLRALRQLSRGGQELLRFTQIDVDQFYGIEIEEFPAQIAQVALWLVDHQMNLLFSEEFGVYYARIPLKTSPHIVNGNALQLDWAQILTPERCSFVLGNPPFIGSKLLSEDQRNNARVVLAGVEGAGLLDFVAAWYVKATRYGKSVTAGEMVTRFAFVSTSSITQGEQVVLLWSWLLAQGIHIHFAHRTFRWNNEARGVAAVHCVIIGFGLSDVSAKTLFEYEDVRGESHAVPASHISPYLIDGPDILAIGRSTPIQPVPLIVNGSIPADGGHLILSDEERAELLLAEPAAADFIRPYVGAEDFIHGLKRYCLWLVNCSPSQLRLMPQVLARVRAVQQMREASKKAATQAKAATSTLFTENRQPLSGDYLVVPRTSSEDRRYIPLGFLPHSVVAANDLQILPNAKLFEFGILSSAMHMAWVRVTAGRLESRIRYSAKYTYNTFPWPDQPTDKQIQAIETAAQDVLIARNNFSDSTFADLYDRLSMPPALVQAHHALDRTVDAAYGKRSFGSESARVAFLFELYAKYTSFLPSEATPRKRRNSAGR